MAGMMAAQEVPRFAFNVGGGFTQPVGGTGRRLDTGYNLDAGAGINFHPNFGAMLEFNFNDMNVNRNTLNVLGYPDGTMRMWSITLDPIIYLHRGRPFGAYLIGGGGLYHRSQEFTTPAVATVTGFDPFFGSVFAFNVPVNQVLSSYSVNKPGVNGGMGITIGTKWHGSFYAEARYHRMFLSDDRHTDIVPVTFGFRW